MATTELVMECKRSVAGVPSCKDATLLTIEKVEELLRDTSLVAVEGGTKSLRDCGWSCVQEPYPRLVKKYEWPKNKKTSFQHPWKFVDVVAEMAEEAGHHPDISFGWGYADIVFTTHWIKGVSAGDPAMAAKVEEAYNRYMAALPAPAPKA